MSKHTPGPWKSNECVHRITGETKLPGIAVWTEDGERMICSTIPAHLPSCGIKDVAEMNANCRLIAAAPALLEACKMYEAHHSLENVKHRPNAFHVSKAIRAAIALAEQEPTDA